MPLGGTTKAGGNSGTNNVGGGSPKSINNSKTSTPKTTYTVKSGDTLSQISKKLGQSVPGIMANNPQIKNADKISAGDKINLSKTSNPTGYSV
jgi:LysM repeat protein